MRAAEGAWAEKTEAGGGRVHQRVVGNATHRHTLSCSLEGSGHGLGKLGMLGALRLQQGVGTRARE